MRIAALDVGSNSFHLVVVEVSVGGRIEILDRAKEMVRLGDATFRQGVITPEAFRRGLEALRTLRRTADRHRPDALVAVATSAVREAQNGGDFVRAARDEVGLDIRVIRGQDEAHLIYLGARAALDVGNRRVALFDLGGGSLEVILADATESYYTGSLKLGVIRLTEAWAPSDPPTARELAALAQRARDELTPVITRLRSFGFDFVAFTSGTASALGVLLGRGLPGVSKALSVRGLYELERKLAGMSVAERERLAGLDPRRADTILTGAVVLRTVLELCAVDEGVLCDAALREGLVADYVARNRPEILLVDEFPDLRRRSVMELCRQCHFPEAHATQVARLALAIFHQTRELHDLPVGDAELLEYAALLHDIGFYISQQRHHRHAEYLITSREMPGFSPEETALLAQVARYHRKGWPKRKGTAFGDLPKSERRRARRLIALLRVADALDRTHASLIRSVRCLVTDEAVEMRLDVDEDPELEIWAARRKGDLFEHLFGRKLRFAVERGAYAGQGDGAGAKPEAGASAVSVAAAEPTRALDARACASGDEPGSLSPRAPVHPSRAPLTAS